MEDIMIELISVSYGYNDSEDVISDISLTINDGEFLAIVGHNGSGKSTVAKHLNGLLLPRSGQVYVNGLLTSDEESILTIRQNVGMVFQNPDNQIVTTVVEEDVGFGPENLGIETPKIWERVDEALELVGMTEFRKRAPHMLSGGQKQRLAIAGVLAMHPSIIVFDEATAMLDPKGREDVIAIMKDLHAAGKTIVMITQHMEEVLLSDRVIVMNAGRIAMDGTPTQIFENADKLRSMGLDVPLPVAIRDKLNASGMNIPASVLTLDSLADEIEKRLSR
ncbi:MAG: energy-coupling factor transporter ATPase [Clostridia bacterium]|nr:energy-coupling factor transporter ATPase [Clostridia bacterium]